MSLPRGICMACGRHFWWTGSPNEVPNCGNCKRQHNSLDFNAMKEIDREASALMAKGIAANHARRRAEALVRRAYGFTVAT